MLVYWVVGCVLEYLLIGLVTGGILLKSERKCLDKIEIGEDIFIPMFLWPIFVIFCICDGASWVVKNIFRFIALYIFKIPATTLLASQPDDGGFVQGTSGGGSNPPPSTPKPNITPPSQKKDEVPTSRASLIDID